jgi:hypothetical protein
VSESLASLALTDSCLGSNTPQCCCVTAAIVAGLLRVYFRAP